MDFVDSDSVCLGSNPSPAATGYPLARKGFKGYPVFLRSLNPVKRPCF